MKTGIGKKIIYLLTLTLVFFLFLEGAMRIVKILFPAKFHASLSNKHEIAMQPDRRLIFGPATLKKHGLLEGGKGEAYRLNSFGWRGPEIPPKKKADTRRIMFLGDSSVWGILVTEEQSFPFLSGRLVQNAHKSPVLVMNAAQPGYSSTQSRIVFEDTVDTVKPDVLVIANLWSDMIVRPWTDEELLLEFSMGEERLEEGGRRYLRKSAIFEWLELKIKSLKGIPRDIDYVSRVLFGPDVDPADPGVPRVSIEQHRKNLQVICSMCKQRGIEVVLLLLPFDPAVFKWPEKKLQEYRENYFETASKFNVPLVDAVGVFPSEPEKLSDLFSDGIHPNVKGHELIANVLAAVLLERL